MPYVYDYEKSVIVDGVSHNKKFVFVGNSSNKAEMVYEAPKHWVDVDPTKDSFTQDEFILVCNGALQSQMKVGAKITLNNQYCNTFEVIGINHDGTTNTVDIMPTTQVGNMTFGSSQYYNGSLVQTWINGTYLSAFDSIIQNLAKTMSVVTNGSTITEKVKLLSCTEVNYSSSYALSEGTAYEAFTASGSSRWRDKGSYGNSSYYWLRSRYPSDSYYVWSVRSYGNCFSNDYNNTYGVLPVLRF